MLFLLWKEIALLVLGICAFCPVEGREVAFVQVQTKIETSVKEHEPLFPGMQVGGQVQGVDLSKEVDLDAAPPCTFYIDSPGTCVPDDVHSPCRYCKTKTTWIGTPECPEADSFEPSIAHLYVWRLKPVYKKNYGLGKQHLCVVSPAPPGTPPSPGYATEYGQQQHHNFHSAASAPRTIGVGQIVFICVAIATAVLV